MNMPSALSARAGVLAGDLVIAPGDGGTAPPFVVRWEPGPNQFGCATVVAATRLARAFAGMAGVDVWLADASGRVTPLVRNRGLERAAAPPTRVPRGPIQLTPTASVQNSTLRSSRATYSGAGPLGLM